MPADEFPCFALGQSLFLMEIKGLMLFCQLTIRLDVVYVIQLDCNVLYIYYTVADTSQHPVSPQKSTLASLPPSFFKLLN